MNAKNGKIRITQVKSGIGQIKKQKLTLKALGITKLGHSVVQNDTSSIRGMVKSIHHLVRVDKTSGV
ncbi:MAG: 50S ribosomal protein L30 [Chitinivibrionales bacterium]